MVKYRNVVVHRSGYRKKKRLNRLFFLETTTERWSLNQFRVLPVDSSLQSQQKWRFK